MTRHLSHLFLVTCLALVITAVTGCREKEPPGRSTLLEAERLIDIWQLDSAQMLLDASAAMPLSGKADSALYALNYIRMKKMQGIVLSDDSLASIATDFYSNNGDIHRAMLAWYYRTCLLFDNHHYSEAALTAEKMRSYARLDGNHLYLARYGDIMGHCSELVGKNLSAARYYTYSYRQFKNHIPDNDNYLDFFFCLARNAWLKAGRIDSALALSYEIKPIILEQTDTNTVSRWISNHATMLLNNRVRDYEGARAVYREMDSIGAPYWPEASNHRIAQALIRALADSDTASWHEAMAYIDEYGTTDIAYGYFVDDMTLNAEDLTQSRAQLNEDGFRNEEYGVLFGPPAIEDDEPESFGDASHPLTWGLIALVVLAAGILIFVFRRR